MRRWLWTLLTASAVASGSLVVACGDDDSSPASPNDAGADSPITPPNDSGNNDTGTNDGGDAGCTFAGYVIGLIGTETTATSKPTADLGDNCTPSTSQSDFQSLFP